MIRPGVLKSFYIDDSNLEINKSTCMKILALPKMYFLTNTVSVHIKLLITVHLCDTQIQIFVRDQVIIANLERVLNRKWKLNSVISLAHLYFWRPILTLSSVFI